MKNYKDILYNDEVIKQTSIESKDLKLIVR